MAILLYSIYFVKGYNVMAKLKPGFFIDKLF